MTTGITRENLVLSKKGFNIFSEGLPYRCLSDGDGYIVHGEWFSKTDFESNFDFLYDILIQEWKELGLIKNNLKPISKTAFKKLADAHKYGKDIHVFYFYINPKKFMYGFYPSFKGNKKDAYDDAYDNYIQITKGLLNSIDSDYELVQRGNTGIPILYGDLKWRPERNSAFL